MRYPGNVTICERTAVIHDLGVWKLRLDHLIAALKSSLAAISFIKGI